MIDGDIPRLRCPVIGQDNGQQQDFKCVLLPAWVRDTSVNKHGELPSAVRRRTVIECVFPSRTDTCFPKHASF